MRPVVIATLVLLLMSFRTPGQVHGCTSFCMDTPDGPVFATNCDLFIPGDGIVVVNKRGIAKRGFRESTTGETAKWVSEYGSVSFNLAGREFAWGGMNEAGLVISTMELKASKLPKPDERPPFGSGEWVQYVLDNCGSVQEVMQVDAKLRLIDDADSPGHFLVADAQGDCVAIEYLDREFVCYRGDGLPIRAMSNMRYDRALAAFERGGPRWWWSNPGQSAQRFAACADRIEAFDPSHDTDRIGYAMETLTELVAAPHTRWNIAFDIAGRTIHFRSAASPNLKRISLGALDLSCETPMMTLDVNSPLRGEVEQGFEPYDPAHNLKVFLTFCDRWGINTSEESSAQLMEFFESYECTE